MKSLETSLHIWRHQIILRGLPRKAEKNRLSIKKISQAHTKHWVNILEIFKHWRLHAYILAIPRYTKYIPASGPFPSLKHIPTYLQSSLSDFIQISTQKSSCQRGRFWPPYLKQHPPSFSLPSTCFIFLHSPYHYLIYLLLTVLYPLQCKFQNKDRPFCSLLEAQQL